MNAELTAENIPACVCPDSALSTQDNNQTTDEDEEHVQVLVVLFRVIPVKFPRFFTVCSEEASPGIIDLQWFEEFLEGGMEADSGCRRFSNGLRIAEL